MVTTSSSGHHAARRFSLAAARTSWPAHDWQVYEDEALFGLRILNRAAPLRS